MLTRAQSRALPGRILRSAVFALLICGVLLLYSACRSAGDPGATAFTGDPATEARAAGLPVFVHSLVLRPPNGVGGVDLELDVQNVSDRTIKLVLFVFRAYDRGGNPARCNIRRSAEYTVRVEALPPGEHSLLSSQGAYYNRQLACVTPIDAIQIIYDDNSTERIDEPQRAFASGLICPFQPST